MTVSFDLHVLEHECNTHSAWCAAGRPQAGVPLLQEQHPAGSKKVRLLRLGAVRVVASPGGALVGIFAAWRQHVSLPHAGGRSMVAP